MKFPLLPLAGSAASSMSGPEIMSVAQLMQQSPDLLAQCINISMGDTQSLLDYTVKRQFGMSNAMLDRVTYAGYLVTDVTVYDDTPETVTVTLPWCVADDQVVVPHVTQPLIVVQYLMRDPRFAKTVNIDAIKHKKSQALKTTILSAIPSVSAMFSANKGASILTALPSLLPMLGSFNGPQQQLRVKFTTRYILVDSDAPYVDEGIGRGPQRVLLDALTPPVATTIALIDPKELVMDPSIIGAVSQAFQEVRSTKQSDDDDDVYKRGGHRVRGQDRGSFSAD